MAKKCYSLENKWRRKVREEMRYTARRRKIEAKLDKGKPLVKADKEKLSYAKSKENIIGRELMRMVTQAKRDGCTPFVQIEHPPSRKGIALKARRQNRSDLTAREQCEFVCGKHAGKAIDLSDEGAPDSKIQFHANRYWSCVRDCFETKLPRKQKYRSRAQAQRKRR